MSSLTDATSIDSRVPYTAMTDNVEVTWRGRLVIMLNDLDKWLDKHSDALTSVAAVIFLVSIVLCPIFSLVAYASSATAVVVWLIFTIPASELALSGIVCGIFYAMKQTLSSDLKKLS